jgi:transglutaminase-like putative cysteine protease
MIGIVLMLFWYSLNYSYNNGQLSVVRNLSYTEDLMLRLSSNSVLNQLRSSFPAKLNYAELLVWESQRLNYTENRIVHDDPIEILKYGKGACGEFSILYVAICLSNNVSARLLTPAYIIPNVVDHIWAEVNPSNDGKIWIQIDPTDACAAIQKGVALRDLTSINNTSYYANRNYDMVLAFQATEDRQVIITDRTDVYFPKAL